MKLKVNKTYSTEVDEEVKILGCMTNPQGLVNSPYIGMITDLEGLQFILHYTENGICQARPKSNIKEERIIRWMNIDPRDDDILLFDTKAEAEQNVMHNPAWEGHNEYVAIKVKVVPI